MALGWSDRECHFVALEISWHRSMCKSFASKRQAGFAATGNRWNGWFFGGTPEGVSSSDEAAMGCRQALSMVRIATASGRGGLGKMPIRLQAMS